MKPGDKWELVLSSELAYDEKSRGKYITPGSILILQLELLLFEHHAKFDWEGHLPILLLVGVCCVMAYTQLFVTPRCHAGEHRLGDSVDESGGERCQRQGVL
jgi:hypothetical protein